MADKRKDIFVIEYDSEECLTALQVQKALKKKYGIHGITFKVQRAKFGPHTMGSMTRFRN